MAVLIQVLVEWHAQHPTHITTPRKPVMWFDRPLAAVMYN